jgi:hypothetical protein
VDDQVGEGAIGDGAVGEASAAASVTHAAGARSRVCMEEIARSACSDSASMRSTAAASTAPRPPRPTDRAAVEARLDHGGHTIAGVAALASNGELHPGEPVEIGSVCFAPEAPGSWGL